MPVPRLMFSRQLQIPLESRKSFFLFGPRGTGKMTWLRQNLPEALFINLLRSDFYLPLSANPAHLRALIPDDYAGWIVIDEVQRVPELLNEVHDLIESKKHVFILTGSSARKLRRDSVNLLAGRALTYHMHPLTVAEQGDAFRLEDSLRYGHLPARFNEPDPARYLRDYVQTYLREEVMQEGLTRNIGQFSRFLEVASFSQGSVVNLSEIARDAHIQRPVAESYFSIVEDLLIGVRLPVFSKRAKRQLITHAKFYYFDTGVYRAIRPTGPLDSPAEIDGPALETLVLQEVRAINDYLALGYDIHFWRTKHGLEVDFVLHGPQGLVAIEIKRAGTAHPADLRGLREFKRDYPEASCILLYGGEQPLYLDDIRVIPIRDALRGLGKLLLREPARDGVAGPRQ
jgi:predicted AAA+ superfamily ATPase